MFEECNYPRVPMGTGEHYCKFKDFADWIISLDDLEMLAIRRSMTLSLIIEEAKAAHSKD